MAADAEMRASLVATHAAKLEERARVVQLLEVPGYFQSALTPADEELVYEALALLLAARDDDLDNLVQTIFGIDELAAEKAVLN
jgi:hypothetical protein